MKQSPLAPQRRHSLLRDAILSLLAREHYLSGPDLLKQLHKVGRKVNKTSMYRALEILLADGKICRHHFHDGEMVYEVDRDHHDHLVCTSCGKIVTIPCQFNQPGQQQLTPQLAEDSEFTAWQIDHHHLTWYGVCESCLL